ncbi:MAG: IS1595 family transposase [Gammaproteobacteria bacterium]|nr:IS1595 family transposase [Gammaproteobacteria bacterium]
MAKGPGKSFRKGLSLMDLAEMFPTDRAAEEWVIAIRWPNGVRCPCCDSDNIQARPTRKPQPFRCRSCRKDFSVKTGTVMQSSNLGLRKWAFAVYLMTTGLKGTSSMKLRRDLGITQKTAWHLGHRIREAFQEHQGVFDGPVEIDETFIGGKEKNKHAKKRLNVGGGTGGKAPVVGIKDRATGEVMAAPMANVTKKNIGEFAGKRIKPGAKVYTDGASAYPMEHEAVKHSVGEYVRGQVHTNGVESFWAMLKRGYYGTYHRMSVKHLGRYVREFSGRHNQRLNDTLNQMAFVVAGMVGKRLRYKDLVAEHGNEPLAENVT